MVSTADGLDMAIVFIPVAGSAGRAGAGPGWRHRSRLVRRAAVATAVSVSVVAAGAGAWALSSAHTGSAIAGQGGARPAHSSTAGSPAYPPAGAGARAVASGGAVPARAAGSAVPAAQVSEQRTSHNISSSSAQPPAAAQSVTPAQPSTPVHSAAPAQPSTPAQPSSPVQTNTPVQPSAPAQPPATPAAARGILPPANPPANIPPNPNFLDTCAGTVPDTSAACQQAALQAIDAARGAEGLPAMVLPTDWLSLTPAEQLFTVTNLERTVRGLPALAGMSASLDQAAALGAAQSADPAPPASFGFRVWASNWGGALGSPLEADYLWMYDDGPGSANVDCPTAGAAGCWGHRDNVLVSLPCTSCVMGTALDPTGWKGYPAWAELLVEASGPVSTVFAWNQVTPYLPAAER